MTEQGRQGENKRAANFHPNSHTHMEIHTANANHPKPLAFLGCFFGLGPPPLYNITTQIVTHETDCQALRVYGAKFSSS